MNRVGDNNIHSAEQQRGGEATSAERNKSAKKQESFAPERSG
jgi:hypothetical protein